MNLVMSKDTRLNLRIKPEFKADLEAIAEFHGLTISSYVHSVLVKKVREEKEKEPHLFGVAPKKGRLSTEIEFIKEEEGEIDNQKAV